jgi:PAS domain S-box-containing protein
MPSAVTNDLVSDHERYRVLVNAITDYGVYMLDAEGRVASWNTGAQRFKGYEASEILGRHFEMFYTPEDRATGLPHRALETAGKEGRFESEGWRVRKDGSRFWAHVVIDPIRDPAGALIGFAKITRDLTERRAAAETLRQSEQQFRLLVQSVTDYAIYMLDPQGQVTSWNVGAERIKGYLPAEIIGQHFSRFYLEEDQRKGEPQKALETAAREGRFEKEALRVRKDGSSFWAHVVIDPIRDESGLLIGFAKVTRDITERKAAERALEEARQALLQSQKIEAIGQLTGGIAHDFNNLLMAVLGSLELLRRRIPNDPQALRLLDNAVQGAERGATLTQRMLSFARRQDLKPRPVDLADLVRGMTHLLERSIGAGIFVEVEVPAHLPPVKSDIVQLETALLNLAINARDAMPGGGSLIISARAEQVGPGHASRLPPGLYVCLSVADHGEGMDAETLARAKDPFFTTKGIGKGTGLGLPMVQGLAEQSGGRLVLKSCKGEGTTAELWLPAADPNDLESVEESKAPEAPARSRQFTIVAVDDDPLVLMNTTAMLEDLGHIVFEASSGAEALGILRSERGVDCVISDQSMPRMTGVQLAEIIRAKWPRLPVLLATGYAELPGGVGRNLPKLAKPFRQHDLARALDRVMEDKTG